MGSFCESNEVVVWRKAGTCRTTCSHKDYILSLRSFFAALANYNLYYRITYVSLVVAKKSTSGRGKRTIFLCSSPRIVKTIEDLRNPLLLIRQPKYTLQCTMKKYADSDDSDNETLGFEPTDRFLNVTDIQSVLIGLSHCKTFLYFHSTYKNTTNP